MNKFAKVVICTVFPLVLTSCQGYDGWFGDDYNSESEYHHSYSASQSKHNNETVTVGENKVHASKASSSASGAAAATNTSPTATTPAHKGSGVPVEAPAVPSVAPTVGQ